MVQDGQICYMLKAKGVSVKLQNQTINEDIVSVKGNGSFKEIHSTGRTLRPWKG